MDILNNKTSKYYKIMDDLTSECDIISIVEKYGIEIITLFCKDYFSIVTYMRLVNHGTRTEKRMKNLISYIETDSKEEFPQLWI